MSSVPPPPSQEPYGSYEQQVPGQSPAYPGGYPVRGQSEVPSEQPFWKTFFNTNFDSFITVKILRILFVIALVVAAIVVVVALIVGLAGIGRTNGGSLLVMLGTWLGAIVWVLMARVSLELTVVLFRINDNAAQIARNTSN